MPIQLLPMGVPFTLLQNQIYALPPVKCTLFTDATTPTIQQSNTATFVANAAVTVPAGQATLNGGFIRVTTAGPTVIILKRD